MGKCMFRLSDMMPNSWFYKLKDMSRAAAATTTTTKHPSKRLLNNPKPKPKPTPTPTTKKQQSNSNSNAFPQPNQLYIPNRPSSYISSDRAQTEHLPTSPAHPKASDTHFPLGPAPRKSKKKHRHRRRSSNDKNMPVSCPANSSSSSSSASAYSDIIIDMKRLPPIHTKPPAKRKEAELDSKQIMLRRAQQGLHRIRVRPSTPKIEVKRVSRKVGRSRRLAESFVIVKRSADPMRDFKESMVEMIVENDIRGSKDLEDLLACYLSLNSVEYHDLIVKVFEDIWIYLTDVGATDCLIVKYH